MSATLSILGLYQFDSSIFDEMAIPQGVDLDTVVNNILMECAEFEVLYTDPPFMKAAIKAWSNKNLPVWDALFATTHYTYDPIYNYDRTEEYTDTEKTGGKSTRSPNLTDETSHGLTTTQAQNSFENAGMVDAVRNTNSGKDTITRKGKEELENSEDRTFTHKARLYGNIGVTTTQQMIQQERDISEFNIYDRIILDFKLRFCLMIY